MRRLLVVGAVLAGGCHDFWSLDYPVDAGAPREVKGAAAVRHFPDGPDGGVDEPLDLSQWEISAGYISTDDGTYHESRGTGAADGTFDFPGVGGPVAQISLGDGYTYVTGATSVSIRYDEAGRAVDFASQGTELDVDLDGLSPWETTDTLMISAPAVGLFQVGVDYGSPTAIAAGATSRPGFVIAADYFPLFVDTDDVTITQLRYDSMGNQVAIRGGTLAPVALSSGNSASSSVTLADLPQEQLAIDWDIPSFAAIASSIDPRAQAAGAALSVARAPGGVQPSAFAFGAAVLASVVPGSARFQQQLAYGESFPTSWPRYVVADLAFDVPRTLAGQSVMVFADATTVTTGTGTIRLAIGPPTSVAIDGRTNPSDSVGANPMVTWQPPAMGTPDGYIVDLEYIDSGYAYTIAEDVVAPSVTQVVLSIPVAGSYVVVVGAVSDPGSDFATRPNDRSLNWARTDAVSGAFTH